VSLLRQLIATLRSKIAVLIAESIINFYWLWKA